MNPAWPASAYRDARALAPTWATALVIILAAHWQPGAVPPTFAVLGYVLGSAVVGALAMGHEYGSGTIGLLLAQPLSRRSTFFLKLAVAAPMIASLGAAASLSLLEIREFLYPSPGRVALTIGWFALFVAPVLTMVCRSAIAGTVFTIAIPGVTKVVGDLVGLSRFGFGNAGAIDRFSETLFWTVMCVVGVVAVPAGWILFQRLQAMDGPGSDIQVTRVWGSAGATARRPRHPIVQLALKELHLHQMPFVFAGIFVIGAMAVLALKYLDPQRSTLILQPITALYVVALPVLIGAVASAEERQFGTLQTQAALPISRRTQFAVKTTVALSLAVALTVLIPGTIVLLAGLGPRLGTGKVVDSALVTTAGVSLLTAGALYASSLSTSSLRALIGAIALLIGTLLFSTWIQWAVWVPLRYRRIGPDDLWIRPELILMLLAATLVVPLVRFAYVNHFSQERKVVRVAVEIVALETLVIIATILIFHLQL